MSVEKSLKFQFVLEDASFNRVMRAMDQILAKSKELAKALSGVGMPGGGGGQMLGGTVGRSGSAQSSQSTVTGNSGMAKLLNDNANAFKNMATLGTSSFRGLTDALRTNIRSQSQELSRLQGALDKLGQTYERLGGQGQKAAAVQAAMVRVAGRISSGQASASEMRDLLGQATGGAAIPPPPPWGQGAAGQQAAAAGGAGGRRGNWLASWGGGQPMSMFGGAVQGAAPTTGTSWLKIGGMVAAGAMAAINESMGGTRMYSGAETARSNLVMPEIRKLRGGDVTNMIARQELLRDQERRADLEAQVGGMGRAGAIGSGILTAGKNLLTMQGGGIGGALADPDLQMAQTAQDQVNQYAQSVDFMRNRGFALERFYGDFGSRVSSGRILGTGLSRKTGLRPGQQGLGSLPGFGGMGLGTEGVDSYGALQAKLQRQGYDPGQLAAATTQSRHLGMGGKGAYEMMAASAFGFGEWGNVMAGGARGVAGRRGVPGTAQNMAYTATGTTSNLAAAMQLGGMLGFDPRGTTSGVGMMSAVQGGFGFGGGIADMNTAARIQAGMAGGDKLAGGFDQYQQGRNLVSSIGLNPGGTTYAQDYLGTGMNFKQLMDAAKGDMTVTGRSLGITSDMARQQLGAMGGSVFERFVDQGGSDPMSKAIRGFRESGMGITDYLGGLKGKKGGRETAEALGAFMGMEMGIGEEGGLGLAGLYSGMNLDPKKLKRGKGPAGGLGEGEKAVLEQQAKAMVDDARVMGEMHGQFMESVKQSTAEMKKMADFGSNLGESAKVFVESLNGLADAIKETTDNIKAGKRGSSSAPSSGTKATPKTEWLGKPADAPWYAP